MSSATGREPHASDNPQPLSHAVTRRQMLKGVVLGGATVGVSSLLSGCYVGKPEAGASAGPKNGGHLRVGMTDLASNDTLDPHLAGTSESGQALNFNCFDRLLAFSPDQRQVVNQLADEVEVNASATEYTVRLKGDLAFHNGKSVTADDVVFSFDRMRNPKDPKALAPLLAGLTQVRKLDRLTARFQLARPNAAFKETLAHYAAVILPEGFQATGRPDSLVGTGAFKVEGWTQGRDANFSRFAQYHGQVPHVERMTWYGYNDATAQINALLSGAIDWATNIQPSQARVLKETPGLSLFTTESGGYAPFVMRVDQPPFTDPRVRQAFRLVVDRQQMIDATMSGLASLGNDMYGRYDSGYPDSLPQREQDIEQARSLLRQAGHGAGLNIDLNTSHGVTAYAVPAATVFAEQAAKAGINVKVKNLDASVLYGDNWLNWTFSMDSWGTRPYLATAALATLPKAPWNQTHWHDEEWTAIVDQAFSTVDDAKRTQLVVEAQKIEYARGGQLIWSFPHLIDGHSSRVKGAVHDMFMTSACGWRFNELYFA